jgi:hypothetical protein
MSDIIEVIKDVTTVTIASDGPQGPTGPTGATGAAGATGATGSSGVISVVAPITNTGTATSAVIGINAGVANGVATLDSGGKVPQSQIPAVAITNTFVVASQAAMLALTAEEGDVAVRTDQNKTYILTATPASTLANWQELLTPTDTVTSVDGRIGTVTLTDKYAQLATANTFTGGVQQITTASAATVGLIVKGSASQGANLFEAQDSAGNVLHSLTPTQLILTNSTASSNRGLTIRQSFGSIAGSTLAMQKSRGSNASPTVVAVGDIIGAIALGSFTGATYLTDTTLIGASVTGVSGTNISQSIFITTGSGPSNYNPSILVYHTGAVGIGANFGSIIGTLTAPTAALQVNSIATGTPVLIARGAASQTANLQEWQNSSGTVLTKIDSAGNLVFTQAGANITTPTSGRLNIGGAVYGSTAFGTISVIGDSGGYAIDARGNAASGSIGGRVRPGNAANVGFIIAGETSQTADLQTWRSSTALLTAITAAGTINFASGNTSATANTGAVALPALAVGFITMQVAGTTVKVPYYAN